MARLPVKRNIINWHLGQLPVHIGRFNRQFLPGELADERSRGDIDLARLDAIIRQSHRRWRVQVRH